MNIFKTYFLTALAVLSMAPMQAMEAPPAPGQVTNTLNIALLKIIEREIRDTLQEMVASLRKMIDANSRTGVVFNKSAQLSNLANQLPVATMSDLKTLLSVFTSHVQAFEAAFAKASLKDLDDLVARIENARKCAEEIKSHFKKANALNQLNAQMQAKGKQKKSARFNDAQLMEFKTFKTEVKNGKSAGKSALPEVVPMLQPDLAPSLANKSKETNPIAPIMPKHKAAFSKKSVLAAAGFAGLAAGGYAAFKYFVPSATVASALPEVAPVAPSVDSSHFDVYRWLAGQTMNPYQ